MIKPIEYDTLIEFGFTNQEINEFVEINLLCGNKISSFKKSPTRCFSNQIKKIKCVGAENHAKERTELRNDQDDVRIAKERRSFLLNEIILPYLGLEKASPKQVLQVIKENRKEGEWTEKFTLPSQYSKKTIANDIGKIRLNPELYLSDAGKKLHEARCKNCNQRDKPEYTQMNELSQIRKHGLRELIEQEFSGNPASPSKIYLVLQTEKYKPLHKFYPIENRKKCLERLNDDLRYVANGFGKKQDLRKNNVQKRRETLAQIIRQEGKLETITTFELTEAIRSGKYCDETFKEYISTDSIESLKKKKTAKRYNIC